MRVVAIGRDRVCDNDGERLDPADVVRDLAEDELVLVHDLDAAVAIGTIEEVAADVAGADVVVGAWTFVDERHGVVERRGVLSTEHLRWANTVGPALLVSGAALRQSGWGTDGDAGLHDLLLRLVESVDDPDGLRVHSVSTVFAHLDGPSAGGPGLRSAVERHLARVGVEARVEELATSHGREPSVTADPSVVVDRNLPGGVTVSIVVPTTGRITDVRGRRARLVVNLLDTLVEHTDFPRHRIEILLVTGPEMDPDLPGVVADRFGDVPVRFVTTVEPFSHSRRTNRGVVAASGDVVVLLNDDTEVVSPDWLRQIVATALEPDVGLVGPLLRYPDGSIQSAGHAHPHANISEPMAQIAPSQEAAIERGRDVAGVTLACAAIARDRYLRVGGLSARIHNAFNDVDLAMKLSAAGFRHVSLGHVEMVHLETATRAPGVQGFEAAVLDQRWGSSMRVEHLHHTDHIHAMADR